MSHVHAASLSFIEYSHFREMAKESKSLSQPTKVTRRPSSAPGRSSTAAVRPNIPPSSPSTSNLATISVAKPVVSPAEALAPAAATTTPAPTDPHTHTRRLRKAVSYRVRTQKQLVALLSTWDEDERDSPIEAIIKWIELKQAKGKTQAEIVAKLESLEYGFHRILHMHPLFHTARRQTGLPPSLTLPGDWGLSTTTHITLLPSTPSSGSTEKGKSPASSLADRKRAARPRLTSETHIPPSPSSTIRPSAPDGDAQDAGYMSDPSTSGPRTPPLRTAPSMARKHLYNPLESLQKAALRQLRSVTSPSIPSSALPRAPPGSASPRPNAHFRRPSLSVNTVLSPDPIPRPQTSMSMSFLDSAEYDEDVGGGGGGAGKMIEALLEDPDVAPLSPGAAQTFLRLFRMAA